MTVTLITGANKGLGFETARQLIDRGHTVYLVARNVELGEVAAGDIGARFVQLDVTDDVSVQSALDAIRKRERRLDVVVNNAGISTPTADITGDGALAIFDTNVVGGHSRHRGGTSLVARLDQSRRGQRLQRAWLVLGGHESGAAAVPPSVHRVRSEQSCGLHAHGPVRKAHPDIKSNAVEPGFTATDLTPFSGAGQPVGLGAEVIVSMATIGADGPTSTFVEREGALAW